MLKVSVIVPVYKVPLEYLRMCLDSLVAQTMQECEFIIVSDGAPKAECSICEEYAAKDSRFKFFKREHAGVSAARNYGIDQAQGEYITFVDADDWIESEMLLILYKKASLWTSDIIATNSILYKGSNPITLLWQKKEKIKLSSREKSLVLDEFILLKDNSIPRGVWAKLYKRDLLKRFNILFDTDIKIQEDTLFNFICFSKAERISYSNTLMYHYRDNPKSTTRFLKKSYLDDIVKALIKIKTQINTKQNHLLGKEFVQCYYFSWKHYYMHSQNRMCYSQRMQELSIKTCSKEVQSLFSYTKLGDFPSFIAIELFLFKRKITFPIWLHGLKAAFIGK